MLGKTEMVQEYGQGRDTHYAEHKTQAKTNRNNITPKTIKDKKYRPL